MGAFPGSENPAFSGGRQSGLDSNKSESSSDERGVDRLLQEGRNSLLQNPTIARHTDDRGVNISEIDAGQKDVQFDAWREARKQKGKLIGDLNSADSQFKGRSPDPGHESRRIDLEYKERTAREAVFAGLRNLSKEELAEIKRILPDLFHEQIGDRNVRAARMRGYLFDCMLNLDESRMQSMRKELANHPGLISALASWKIAKDKLKADLSPAELENLTRRRDEISKLNQIAGQSDSANLQLMTMPDLGDSRGKPGETRRAYNKYGDAIDVSYDQSGIATQFKFTLGREHAREEFESLPGNKGKFNEEVYRDFARSADGELKWDASKKEFVYSGGQIGREFFDVRNDRGSDFNRVFFERTTASTEKPASPLNPKSQPDSRPITETAPRTPAGNDQSSKLSMPPIQSLQDLSRNVGPRVLRLDDAGTSTRAGAERRVSLSSPSGNLQSANVRDKRELLSSFSPPKLLPLSSFGTKDIRSNSDPSSSRLDNQTRKITSMETPEPQGQMREFRPPVNSSGNQWGRSIGNGYEQASRIDHFDRAASGSRQLHGHSYDLSPNFQSGAALTSARQDREQQSENSKVWGRTGSGNDGRRMRSAVSGDSKFEERTKGFADSRSIRTGTFYGRGDRIGLGGEKGPD